MSDLLLVFLSSGGIPPANGTFLEIYRDGGIALLIGNALAEKEPLDEVGLYKMTLPISEVGTIEDFISKNRIFELKEEYTPIRADSGFYELSLYSSNGESKISWGSFANVPEALRKLQAQLNDLMDIARRHPVQVVGATLHVAEPVKAGHQFYAEFSLRNRGSDPLQVPMLTATGTQSIAFKFYATTAEGPIESATTLFHFFQQAQYPSKSESDAPSTRRTAIRLLPGEEMKMRAVVPFTFNSLGNYRLYGFVELALEVIWSGKPITMNCFLVAQPIIVRCDH